MRKRAHLSFGLVGPVLFLVGLLTACGDDEGSSDDEDAGAGTGGSEAGSSSAGRGGANAAGAGGASGGGAGGRGGAGAGGQTGTGTVQEGRQCQTTAMCAPGLVCVDMEAATTPVRICARPCTATGNECMSGEVCGSPYTELARDAHCISLVQNEYEECGVGATADCDGNLFCLYYPRSTVGLCVNFCAVDPTQDAGLEGLPATCPNASQTCVSGVVANEAIGVCGSEVARDTECGIESGRFCMGDDVCAPDDLESETSPQHCRENCTESNACSTGGTCTMVDTMGQGELSYCKK